MDSRLLTGRYVADRYRVLLKVGEGGMGDVYAAEDIAEDRLVALKIMRRDVADPAAPERFLREAETLARVRSRNIVRIYAFDRDMTLGILFVAMELATGDDLSRVLRAGRLRHALTLRVLSETARGLAAAHEAGIVHRDLKPSNLKLKPKDDGSVRVKILDFGLVRDHLASAQITDVGTAPGTLSYLPPEILREEPLDFRGDLYSLGIITYEMMCGKPPFTGRTPLDVATKHLREPPPLIEERIPERTPQDLLRLVYELIAKMPHDRPETALEVHERAEAIARREGWQPTIRHRGASEDPKAAWDLLPHL